VKVAADGSEVPAGVTTLMPASPATRAGAVTVICESASTVKVLAATPSKRTALALANPRPVSTTCVPPAAGPLSG
jgi:hypothetical protein